MNYQEWYINFLIKHPYVVFLAITAFSCICLAVPFTVSKMNLPNFQDPQMGFSTRGTSISNRIITWHNLKNEVRPSGYLMRDPTEYLVAKGLINATVSSEPHLKRRGGRRKQQKHKNKIYGNEKETEHDHDKNEIVYGKIITNEKKPTEGPEIANKWQFLQNMTDYNPNNKHSMYEKDFCGPPDEKYAHVVVSSRDKDDLFTWKNLRSLCKLENVLMNLKNVSDLCIANGNQCCRPWSLPNYIAALYDRHSCLGITEQDITKTKTVIKKCLQYFHHNELYMSCFKKKGCQVPLECLKYNAVYNILNYLTSVSFSPDKDSETGVLEETIIFLPIAASVAAVPLYHELEKLDPDFDNLTIVAMDFGIKSIIFDELLIQDSWCMAMGAAFIFFSIWIYTTSLFLTVITLAVILFALAISYFLYDIVYEISFFPFMNLLTIVICIGIGADDSFIFCRNWQVNRSDQTLESNLSKIMSVTFSHAFKSMFVTTLTSAVAFWGSYVSCVTAISCFSIFAGTAVMVNFLLMMTLFPAAVVIWENTCASTSYWSCYLFSLSCFQSRLNILHILGKCIGSLWKRRKEIITNVVIKLRYFWIGIFTILAVLSIVVVFVYPRLTLPNSTEFQLLSTNHPFEKYDFVYKDKFWFKRDKGEYMDMDYKMPLRFVWGVFPKDNGDHLSPSNFGSLELDPDFDMSDPEAQKWLRNFCLDLREQPFFQPFMGISLTSCFIETFIRSMDRKCYDEFSKRPREPCCQVSKFPFNQTVFDTCIIDEMSEIYSGPPDFTHPKTSGPIFSRDDFPEIRAVVVEFDSNLSFSLSYEKVEEFYNSVNDWMRKELDLAPSMMKRGFFVSELEFYDLQNELCRGTKTAIFVSMVLVTGVLFFSTLNPLLSFLAVVTVTFSILSTLASLVLCDWTLNILEAIAVSTAIGLAVDFSLHYCINYKMCPPHVANNRLDATRHTLNSVMGPTFMAALTTAAAGFFMLFSSVLPYFRIGLFLVLIMGFSWFYATFFLGALLAIAGPTRKSCQYTYAGLLRCLLGQKDETLVRTNNNPTSSASSIQDLDRVSFIKHDTPMPTKKKSFKEPRVRYTPSQGVTDQSPSSNITIIMTDDT